MRIMTSNIWGDYFGNEVKTREGGLIETYLKYSPDIIGFQEVTKNWYNGRLFKELSESYCFCGTEIYGGRNFVPFAYKKEYAKKLVESGYEMVCPELDESKAITWAYFADGEKSFAVCNTHFWWKEGEWHDRVRDDNAKQLVRLMKYINGKYSCPVFAFGDMNTTVSSSVFDIYKENGVIHLFDIAKDKYNRGSHHGDPVRSEDGLYHGKTTEKLHTDSIDHIVLYGNISTVEKYTVVEDTAALDSTDHSPVFADIEL